MYQKTYKIDDKKKSNFCYDVTFNCFETLPQKNLKQKHRYKLVSKLPRTLCKYNIYVKILFSLNTE